MENVSNTINMSFRVDKTLKNDADILFKKLGLNTSVALNMFLSQCVREQSLPFVPSMNVSESNKPSKRLIKATKEAEDILSGKIKVKGYNNVDEFINDMLKWLKL